MGDVQVLNIKQFDQQEISQEFYSNKFRIHFEAHHKNITIPHKHDFFVSILFTKGSGIHEIDFSSYQIQPGSVFLMKPGQTHYWELSDDADGYIFFHTQSFYELEFIDRSLVHFPFFYLAQNSPFLLLNKDDTERLSVYFKEINNEHHSNQLLKRQKICTLVDLLYIELSRLYVKFENTYLLKSSVYSKQLKTLEELIEQHYVKEKSPTAYAEMMHISAKHLNRIVRQSLNKTTSDLITERVILEAKRSLVYSKDSLANVSYLLGFEDYAYFSRVFKLKTGMTPSQFASKYE